MRPDSAAPRLPPKMRPAIKSLESSVARHVVLPLCRLLAGAQVRLRGTTANILQPCCCRHDSPS
eukprot:2871441-Alexandrium_andersonii.AAC.1